MMPRYMLVVASKTLLNHRKKKNFDSLGSRKTIPQSAGLRVRALMVLIRTAAEMVNANCLKSCPVIPDINAVGTKTANRTRVVAMTGPVISLIAVMAACLGVIPSAIYRDVLSTTTIASSTTIPIARTIPNRDSMFNENPSPDIIANVPTRETGMATTGTTVARQSCRKMKITRTTRMMATKIVL